MNKEEFLRQLETHLSGMPESEKQEALQYYRDYFEDAGPDKEGEVIDSLGSPADVARSIREENDGGEYTENGYRTADRSNAYMMQPGAAAGQNTDGASYTSFNSASAGADAEKKEKKDTAVIVLSIILIILTCPIWIPALCGLIGLIVGLIGSFIGFAIAGVIMVIACVIALIASIVGMCAGVPAAVGFICIGGAMIVGALGIFFILLTVLVCRYVIPWLCKGVKKLWNLIFGKKEAAR
ncbi:MAG: DUF1700 domain-containing protein [Lachnospiraceae bacterium]|nr:DUF1700 domain-containing protein [Lachnospiraceae bacterium]